MQNQLYDFFDKTKQLHILLSIILVLIVVIQFAPIGKGLLHYSGQAVVIVLLIYILFKNFTETHNFFLVQRTIEKKREKKKKGKKEEENQEWHDMSNEIKLDIKNNTIASYVLCGFILLLLLYVIYSLF